METAKLSDNHDSHRKYNYLYNYFVIYEHRSKFSYFEQLYLFVITYSTVQLWKCIINNAIEISTPQVFF